MKTAGEGDESFFIIGIGTSAGGLETLRKFFDHIPAGFPHSFVIIQHLSPDYKSLMSELLAHNTTMPIHVARQGMKVLRGSIYLIPPKKNLTIRNAMLELDDKPSRNQLNLPIDIFFKSLALDQRDKAFGIILSGTGSDGTQGIRYINDKEGFVMAEAPETAKFDGMPRSAIATGLVDCIKPADELAHELVRIVSSPDARLKNAEKEILRNEDVIQRILFLIERKNGLDFSQYKMPTIARRISRRMMLLNISQVTDYLNHLYDNPPELELMYKDLLIGVTRFFRDTEAFEQLEERAIAEIIRSKSDGDTLKMWIPGCSTGEEPYSIAILVKEQLIKSGKELSVKIFATDIAKDSLDKASRGIYPEAIAADVSPERLSEFFIHKNNQYRIGSEIRKMLIFSQHNILKDPPFTKVDFISCRNLLIYLRSEVQGHVMASLHYALNHNGFLFLGSSETLGDLQRYFKEIDRHHHIYQNIEAAARLSHSVLNYQDSMRHRPASGQGAAKGSLSRDQRYSDRLMDALHEELSAITVVISDSFEVLHAGGDYGRYLELPSGKFSVNILKMVPADLATVISSAIRKAGKEAKKVSFRDVTVRRKNRDDLLDLLVHPLEGGDGRNGTYLLLMREKGHRPHVDNVVMMSGSGSPAEARLMDLENELKETKENLQATLEEVETSNEELQAANEELLASNEELQSTNEELQSLNEELHTVNAEYQIKIRELTDLNNDVENLLRSTNIGTIFLNREMLIRKFTPAIVQQFNLIDGDVGRPIENFQNKLQGISNQSIISDALAVMQNGMPIHREVQMKDGAWHLQRMQPFVDERGRNDGVVITFTNITELKDARREIELLEEKWRSILLESPNVVFTVDEAGTCTYINRMPGGADSERLTGHDAAVFAADPDSGRFREAIQDALHRQSFQQIEVHGRWDSRFYSINISPHFVGGIRVGLVCDATDIGYRLKAEKEREQLISNLELAQSMAQMSYYEIHLKTEHCILSDNFPAVFGVDSPGGNLKKFLGLVYAGDRDRFNRALRQVLDTSQPFELEYRLRNREKQLVDVKNNGYLLFDEEEKPLKIVGLMQNVTHIKQIQNEVLLINELALGIGNANDFEDAVRLMLTRICTFNDWEYGEVWIPGEGGRMFCSGMFHAKHRKYRRFFDLHRKQGSLVMDQGLAGKIISANRPVWFPALGRLSARRFPEKDLATELGFQSAFGFPVNPGPGVLGILIFYNDTRIPKSENLVRLIDVITTQMGAILHKKQGEQLLLLKESREWLSTILEAAPTGIVLTDAAGNIQQVNEQIESIFGYPRDHLVGRNIGELLDVDTAKWLLEAPKYDDQIRGSRDLLKRREYAARTARGEEVPVEVGVNIIAFKSQIYFLASVVDIRRRREAEQLIQASQIKYMDLYERSPDMLLTADPLTGLILECNVTTLECLGYAKPDLIGTSLYDLYTSGCRELAIECHERIPAAGEVVQEELILKRSDGSTLDVLLSARSAVEAGGQNGQMRVSWRDISAIKEARQQLERTLKKLERTNKELEQFAYVASHDLKAPISNLSSLLYLLDLEQGINDQGRLIYDKAVTSIDQMNNTIKTLNEVLSLKNNFSLEAESIDFRTVLELVKAGIEQQIRETSTTIYYDFSASPTVNFPALHLQNILQNLITNAIKYRDASRPPVIEIASGKTAEGTTLRVSDNGMGIDLDRYGVKLFGLFKRFHLHTEGKGIGLYITRSIMENYQGKIEVESKPGSGTTFHLFFPDQMEEL